MRFGSPWFLSAVHNSPSSSVKPFCLEPYWHIVVALPLSFFVEVFLRNIADAFLLDHLRCAFPSQPPVPFD